VSKHERKRDPELLTALQVAARLGVTERAVLAYARTGQLERVVLGRRTIRFEPAAVDTFIASRRTSLSPNERRLAAETEGDFPPRF
jgi:hypothetical protein